MERFMILKSMILLSLFSSCAGISAYYYGLQETFSLDEVEYSSGFSGYRTHLANLDEGENVYLSNVLNSDGLSYSYVVQVVYSRQEKLSETAYYRRLESEEDLSKRQAPVYEAFVLNFPQGKLSIVAEPDPLINITPFRESEVRYEQSGNRYIYPTAPYAVAAVPWYGSPYVYSHPRYRVVPQYRAVEVPKYGVDYLLVYTFVLSEQDIQRILRESRAGIEIEYQKRNTSYRKPFPGERPTLFAKIKGFIASFEGVQAFPD